MASEDYLIAIEQLLRASLDSPAHP